MARKTFKVKLEAAGGGAGLIVPFDVHKVFGSKARVAVRGTINGYPYRGSVFPMGGGKHIMVVNKELRKGAGVEAGDKVSVVMEIDDEPRVVTAPADFKKALAKNKEAKSNFEKSSYTHQKEFVTWIEGAKKEETRARRIEKAVVMLGEGRHL
jgi:hypothetical protein